MAYSFKGEYAFFIIKPKKMENKTKILIGITIALLLLFVGGMAYMNNMYSNLQAENAKIQREKTVLVQQVQEQIEAFDKESFSCEEAQKENDIIRIGYFHTVSTLKHQFDSLSRVSKKRVAVLSKEISMLKEDNSTLLAQLDHEQELYGALEQTVDDLTHQIKTLDFNYKQALASATTNAVDKIQLERQFLADKKTKEVGFEFNDNIVRGSVSYDSTGAPVVALDYPEKVYKKGKKDMKVEPSISFGPSMGYDQMNKDTYAGWGVSIGVSAAPTQTYDEVGQIRSDIEVHMLQKYKQYEEDEIAKTIDTNLLKSAKL